MRPPKAEHIAIALLALLILSACASRPVPLPETHRRELRSDRLVRDSIYIHDSIYIRVKGDTVWRDRIRTLRDTHTVRLRDTVTVRDSIPYPVETLRTVEVDRPLRWHQKTLIYSGIFLWCALAAFAVYKIVKRKILKP